MKKLTRLPAGRILAILISLASTFIILIASTGSQIYAQSSCGLEVAKTIMDKIDALDKVSDSLQKQTVELLKDYYQNMDKIEAIRKQRSELLGIKFRLLSLYNAVKTCPYGGNLQEEIAQINKDLSQAGTETPIDPLVLPEPPEEAPPPMAEQPKKAETPLLPFIEVPIVEIVESFDPPTFLGVIGFDTAIHTPADKQLSEFDKEILEKALKRKPAITPKDPEEVWTSIKYLEPKTEAEKQGQVTVVIGQPQVKYRTVDGFIEVINMGENDAPMFVTYIDKVYAGQTSEMTQFKYSWAKDSGAVIDLSPKAEVEFVKPQNKTTQDLKRMVKLGKGTLEAKVKKGSAKEKFGVQTDLMDLFVIGTHFWVSHDQDKRQTVVGVYEGEVEIKARGSSQTVKLSPTDKGPGVIVVTQEIKPLIKFGLPVLAIMIIAGGLLLRGRRHSSSSVAKRIAKR